MTIKKCPYCGSENTIVYFSVPKMPEILSACRKELAEKVSAHLFEASICKDCYLGFNSSPLSDERLKAIYDDYLYISPMDGIGRSKYDGILNIVKHNCHKSDLIVDVGCGDGYLLKELEKDGYLYLAGIEPSPQAPIKMSPHFSIFNTYFSGDTFSDGTVDCFILMHVLEHFRDPFSVLETMRKKLSLRGKIIVEVPYFSGEHHQHLYFFNLKFLKRMCDDRKLNIRWEKMDGSKNIINLLIDPMAGAYSLNISDLRLLECPMGMCLERNSQHQETIRRLINFFRFKKSIVWWGAGSTSVQYLNEIDRGILDGIDLTVVDGDKNKWGSYIPIVNKEVHPFRIFSGKEIPDLVIASSFADEIKKTLKANNISVGNVEIISQ